MTEKIRDKVHLKELIDSGVYDFSHRVFEKNGDFSNFDFRELVLTGANMKEANLAGADFNGSRTMAEVILTGANLEGVDLSHTMLEGSDLSRTKLQRAKLTDSNLISVNFSGSELQGADLSRSSLSNADFSNASLADAVLQRTVLSGVMGNAIFDNADVTGIDLRKTKSNRQELSEIFKYAHNFDTATIDEDSQ